jgi:hypothetical protein
MGGRLSELDSFLRWSEFPENRWSEFPEPATDEERHGFNNLLLLCPVHHAVVDDDETAYTVERLLAMKADHESANADGLEPDESIATRLIANVNATAVGGSVIFTQNQMGGQVAHSITNVGAQPRRIDSAAANALVAVLKALPVEPFTIGAPIGDGEARALAEALEKTLILCGWESKHGVTQGITQPAIYGIHLRVSGERPAVMAFGNWLIGLGMEVKAFRHPENKHVDIFVGHRPPDSD